MQIIMTGNNILKYVFYLCISFTIVKGFSILNEKIAKIDRFEGQCVGQENLAMTFHNLTFVYIGRFMYISGKLIVKHDLNHQIEVLAMIRCRNREALDSCEKYNNLKFSKCCDILNADGQLWTPFIQSITPRIRCPVKAGTYSLDNATFDANLALIPVEGWYWRINVKSYDVVTKEQLLCMNVEAEVLVIHKN